MRKPLLLTAAAPLLFLGCVPINTRIDLAQVPAPAPSEELAKARSRVLPMPPAAAWPRLLETLLDMGFQIRSANRDSGVVNVSRTWKDPSSSTLSLEATFLLTPEGTGSTLVRMSATGNWKAISLGGAKSANADISGLSPVEDPQGYSAFLERLAAALSTQH